MTQKVSFKEKAKYFFDNTLSRGTASLIMWLGIMTVVTVVFFAIVYTLTGVNNDGENGMGFFESFWQGLMRTLDAGTMGGDSGWGFRIVSFGVTLGGIFIVSALIGVLNSGLEARLDTLRKGRSRVLETQHTLILGWSPKIFYIIRELVVAGDNQKKPRIVILADKDKIEMEDEIRDNIDDLGNMKIVCRSGDQLDVIDLDIVSPHDAKSIIVLSPEDVSNPDTYVLKSVLAITHNPRRKKEKYHIVAEIKDESNLEAAELVGKDEAVYVITPDMSARITAQTCRQSGLSTIYTQLLSFVGDELYFNKEKTLEGKTYKDAIFAYEDSAVIGLKNAKGEILINPLMNTVIELGTEVLAISEDDDTVKVSGKNQFPIKHEAIFEKSTISTPKPEKNLILGWNYRGATIARELDQYVQPGSELHVVLEDTDIEEIENQIKKIVKKQKVTVSSGNIADRLVLVSTEVQKYDSVIILSYQHMDVQESDAKTLIALLHLRNIVQAADHKINIVSEMCDIKNKELAEVTKADDFIISDNLISQMLTQLSENLDIKKVFDILFEAEGSEIYLKNISDYIDVSQPVSFYTVLESAAHHNHTAIGYRLAKDAYYEDKNFGIKVNPKKSELIQFGPNDKLIVVAED